MSQPELPDDSSYNKFVSLRDTLGNITGGLGGFVTGITLITNEAGLPITIGGGIIAAILFKSLVKFALPLKEDENNK